MGRDGASVVVNYSGNQQSAQEVVKSIESTQGKAIAIQADMSQLADIHRLFEGTIERFGKLDILVNNAGTGLSKPLLETTEEEFDRILALNTKGTFFALQEAARRIKDDGRIVNISSAGTITGDAKASVYIGSKLAVEGFSLCLGKQRITVNAVSCRAFNLHN